MADACVRVWVTVVVGDWQWQCHDGFGHGLQELRDCKDRGVQVESGTLMLHYSFGAMLAHGAPLMCVTCVCAMAMCVSRHWLLDGE